MGGVCWSGCVDGLVGETHRRGHRSRVYQRVRGMPMCRGGLEPPRPFDKPKSGRTAIKVINHLGDEVTKVFRVG